MSRISALGGRLRSVPPVAQDALLAAGLCALDLRTQWDTVSGSRWIGEGPVAWPVVVAYGVAGYAALAWRRRHPYLVFAILCAHCAIGQVLLPYRPFLGVLVAFYLVSSQARLAGSLYALSAVLATSALTVADEVNSVPASDRVNTLIVDVILFGLLDLAVWGIGRWVRRSRRAMDNLDLRRRTAARAAVAAERVRIARELHDIVAHSVTVMVLQAAGARRVLTEDSPQVREALTNIEATGRQAMGELRRLLGLLANGEAADGAELDELGPHPGLADLPPVLARVAAAGLPIELRQHGTPRPLDTSVDLAAHRVVTEGLTNALKHGGAGAQTLVVLDWHDDALTVSVTDDGRGHQPAEALTLSSGHGLIGLGERVRAVGGVLVAGGHAPSGFRVSATLPSARPPSNGSNRPVGDGIPYATWISAHRVDQQEES